MRDINIPIIKNFIKYFTSWQIEEVAKEVGFIKRSDGKLFPDTFLKAFTIGLWSSQYATMTQTVELCEDLQEGLSITKQALHKKLELGSKFLKEMFNLSMEYALRYSCVINTSSALSQFKNIIICDSTYLTLPDKLKPSFKGLGGKGKSESALKVQAEFNLTTRSFRALKLTQGIDCDQSYLSCILEKVEENDLILQDLGYFSTKYLKDVDAKKVYYLTRLQSQIAFFSDLEISKEKPTSLNNILDTTKDIIDVQVFIGREKKTRVAARMVAIRLPPNILNERVRRANKKAASRGKSLTKHQKLLLSWNIIITNVASDKLSSELVVEIYRIRWQIEIIFKAWKSQVECLIYGRLIVITMMTAIYSRFCLIDL